MKFNGLLVKFGADAHITQLQKKGILFCNTLQYFKDLENNGVRGDSLEASNFIGTTKDIELKIWPVLHPEKIWNFKTTRLIMNVTSPIANLYCMYGIDLGKVKNAKKFKLDNRLKNEYDTFLIVTNLSEFLNRLHLALNKNNYCWEHHMVEYLDFSNYYGNRTFFQKDKTYAYQNEFRILIYNDKLAPIKIEIGDISDISIKIKTNVINDAYFIKSII